jgi:hypothetical protein
MFLDQVVVIYCVCDEVTKCLNIFDDVQCKMLTSEVMTFAILSAMVYGCNYRLTRLVSSSHRYFSKILSLSQLVRRIHQIPEIVWRMVFEALRVLLRDKNNTCFIVDSFPLKAYETHKSFRARIFAGKEFHGYTASKKQYFFGIKVHMIIDSDGVPIEFSFTPGSASDIRSLEDFPLSLPEESILLGDKGYTNYDFEDKLRDFDKIKLLTKRKANSKRTHKQEDEYLLSVKRNYVETVFSSIISRMPRHIRARTENGFCLKVMFFILAYMINFYFPLN